MNENSGLPRHDIDLVLRANRNLRFSAKVRANEHFVRSDQFDRWILPDGVAFTGEVKPLPTATAYEKQPTPTIRQRVRQLREPSFPAPFDCIGDPQIPLTRQNKFDLCLR